ncbi:hypothetical protein [Nonomuraea sp. NPDC005650]|uniref:hypothetical protein n=1 Tax=Nonomuraea sp. NPDC005650 TaxID=3157045 RepID=UPI0033AFB61F
MSHDDRRQRLAAVERVDWSKAECSYGVEWISDWLHAGPVMITTTANPGPEDQADAVEAEAVAAFLQHARG